MIIRTKIIATVGPACAGVDDILALAEAGCDVFRINFSHGTAEEHEKTLNVIRTAEAKYGKPLAILGDLCGPKIRLGDVEPGTSVCNGDAIIIQRAPILGNARRISTNLPSLIDEAKIGERLLIDDGKLALEVTAKNSDELLCKVLRGGPISSHKGLNLPDTDLSLSALTAKDREDVKFIAARDFDYVALSFVRQASELIELKEILRNLGSHADVIAKIEKPQAVHNAEAIVDAADAIMVARGDLGVEMKLTEVPVAQKRIAALCQTHGKPCIIATQMLETMTNSATPTRAEVSDVANAVLDHADAVMLSGETSVGQNPAAAVAMMNDIVAEMQAYHDEHAQPVRVSWPESPVTAALAGAVHECCEMLDLSAICVWTATGSTARILGKNRFKRPILALSAHLPAVRKMCLYYGVEARYVEKVPLHTHELFDLFTEFGLAEGVFKGPGDRFALLSGRPLDNPGSTDNLAICELPRR